jgi:hypothetical protein
MTEESMSFQLIKYDNACRAVAEAKSVDEVREIRDVSIAMKAYARQANNHELEADAIEIRMRATRRMDEMRQEQKATIGLNEGGRPKTGVSNTPDSRPTLAEAGIDKNLAKEGRKLGSLSNSEFEEAVKAARDAISRVVKGGASAHDDNELFSEGNTETVRKETSARDELSDKEKIQDLERKLAKSKKTIRNLKWQLVERDATINFLKTELEKARIWGKSPKELRRKIDEECEPWWGPGAQTLQETINLMHAAFFDGKEPQAELNRAPEHVPEAVEVSCENISLIAKSNQTPEHMKFVLGQGPKPAAVEQKCDAVELALNLSKELKEFEQSGNRRVLIEALREICLIARASAASRSEIARSLAIEALINRIPDMSEHFLLKIVETLGKTGAFDLSAITGVWPTSSKARSRRSLSSRVPPMRLS